MAAYKLNNEPILTGEGYRHDILFPNSSLGTIQSTEVKLLPGEQLSSNTLFGFRVSVGEGRIAVGCLNSAFIYLYDYNGNRLSKVTGSGVVSGDLFGFSIAIGNGRIVVGAPSENSQRGAVYVFDLNGNQLMKLVPNTTVAVRFGYDVSISGGKIIIGAPYFNEAINGNTNNRSAGAFYTFDYNGNQTSLTFVDLGTLGVVNGGCSLAADHGRIIYTATSGTGKPYLNVHDLKGRLLRTINGRYQNSASFVFTSRRLRKIDIGSGRIVAVMATAGGETTPRLYQFDMYGNFINDISRPPRVNSGLSYNSVQISSDKIFVGSPISDSTSSTELGIIEVFDFDLNIIDTIQASDGAFGDFFGADLSARDGILAVGAREKNVGASGAGAAYMYRYEKKEGDYWTEQLRGYTT